MGKYYHTGFPYMGGLPMYGKSSHTWEDFPYMGRLLIHGKTSRTWEDFSYMGRLLTHGKSSKPIPLHPTPTRLTTHHPTPPHPHNTPLHPTPTRFWRVAQTPIPASGSNNMILLFNGGASFGSRAHVPSETKSWHRAWLEIQPDKTTSTPC